MNNKIEFIEHGWECPKCGAVMAPHMDVCINCRGDSGFGLATTQPSINDKYFIYPCNTEWETKVKNNKERDE